MSSPERVPLPGSERMAVPNAQALGPADPNERIEVSVYLRPRSGGVDLSQLAEEVSSGKRPPVPRDELAAAAGADPQDIDTVEEFARQHHLDVVAVSQAQRRIVLAGTVADLSAAFGVELQMRRLPDGTTFRERTGPIYVPAELQPAVTGVFGLDNRPQAAPR
jgi:kumamolisin